MKMRDGAAEELWQRLVVENTEPPDGSDYSRRAVRFAEAWAEEMEWRMRDGATVADVVQPAAQAVDVRAGFGITGYMFYWSLLSLMRVWAHGDQLPQWNSADFPNWWRLREAAEPGGLLNPAVLKFQE